MGNLQVRVHVNRGISCERANRLRRLGARCAFRATLSRFRNLDTNQNSGAVAESRYFSGVNSVLSAEWKAPYLSERFHREVPGSSWGCTLPKAPQGLHWPRSVVQLDHRQKQRTCVMSSHCWLIANMLYLKNNNNLY